MTVIISHDTVRRRRFIRDVNRLMPEVLAEIRGLMELADARREEEGWDYLPKKEADRLIDPIRAAIDNLVKKLKSQGIEVSGRT